MADKRADTINLGKGMEYAKVAERLKLWREEHPNGKHESAYEVDVDQTYVFTVWLWNDKTELLDLIKAGITDREALRASADANGNAKGAVGQKDKDFEKLESIALGRALANLGYLASGEIASSEEMEEFQKYRDDKKQLAIDDAIASMQTAKNLNELKKLYVATRMMNDPAIVAAKDVLKAKLEAAEKAPATPRINKQQGPEKPRTDKKDKAVTK